MTGSEDQDGEQGRANSVWTKSNFVIGVLVVVIAILIGGYALGVFDRQSDGTESPQERLPTTAEPTDTPNPQAIEELSPGAIAFTEAQWCRTISQNFQNGYDEYGRRRTTQRLNDAVYISGEVSRFEPSDGYIGVDISSATVRGDDDLISLFRNTQCFGEVYLAGDLSQPDGTSPEVGERVTAACTPDSYGAHDSQSLGYKEFTFLYARNCHLIEADAIPTATPTPRPLSLGS